MRRTEWSLGWSFGCSLLLVITVGSCQREKARPAGAVVRAAGAVVRPAGAVVRPAAAPPSVILRLQRVTATWTAGTLLVECRATLVNRTGRTLGVLTNFGSAFDGFTAVVRHWDHGLLARQGYTYHQSPYATDRPLGVRPGETSHTLRFPIRLPRKPHGPLKLQLVGGLRGTPHTDLRSNIRSAKGTYAAVPGH